MFRIKELRLRAGKSQQKLADEMSVSRSTVAMWETEKSKPSNQLIIKLSQLFDVSTDYLLGLSDNKNQSSKLGARVPVYGSVAAGIPIDAIEDITDYEEIDKKTASDGEYIALMIKGDSMEPRMKEGDVIIVRLQPYADSGDTAVVMVANSEATVKKLIRHDIGISLISTNPSYEPMFFSNKQIEELPVKVLGKVVELRAKF